MPWPWPDKYTRIILTTAHARKYTLWGVEGFVYSEPEHCFNQSNSAFSNTYRSGSCSGKNRTEQNALTSWFLATNSDPRSMVFTISRRTSRHGVRSVIRCEDLSRSIMKKNQLSRRLALTGKRRRWNRKIISKTCRNSSNLCNERWWKYWKYLEPTMANV